MKSEDYSSEHTKNSNIKLANDLITNDNLSSSKNTKKELESEKEIKLDNDNNFNQDITNSIDEINFKAQKHLKQNESMKEILIKDEKDFAQKKCESDRDNNDIEELKIKKDNLNDFPLNLNITKSSDFHIKNSLAFDADKNKDIIHKNRYLNNNINILNENEDEINSWNVNTSPSKIFNSDNQRNKQNNERNIIFNNNIPFKSDVNNAQESPIKEYLDQKYSFDEISFNQKFNLVQKQNNYINLENNFSNEQNKNNYIQTNIINQNNKIINNYFVQKDFNINNFNTMNNTEYNLNNAEFNQNNNFNLYNLYNNNKNICYNNYINLINPIAQKKALNSIKNNDIIIQPNLNEEDYLIRMFGRFGWVCRICNNFNFESRNICNRCKAIKAPKTKKEINERKKEINIIKKKKKENNQAWLCTNCKNINYPFRKFCNRCKIERKKEFPLIPLEPKQKLNGYNINNINIFPMRNVIENHINNDIVNIKGFLPNNNENNNFGRNCFQSYCFNKNNY